MECKQFLGDILRKFCTECSVKLLINSHKTVWTTFYHKDTLRNTENIRADLNRRLPNTDRQIDIVYGPAEWGVSAEPPDILNLKRAVEARERSPMLYLDKTVINCKQSGTK